MLYFNINLDKVKLHWTFILFLCLFHFKAQFEAVSGVGICLESDAAFQAHDIDV